jgi:chromosome partitioning protein
MKTLAFFNSKGGVGKTSLLYHLAHMFAIRERGVVAVDLDPQTALTDMCLRSDLTENLWLAGSALTVYSAMQPLIDGTGNLTAATPQIIADRFALLPGDLRLSQIEDVLSGQWLRCLNGETRAFTLTTAFNRILRSAGAAQKADIGLIDVAPSLGAINRCALIAADFIVFPLGADLNSIRAMEYLGPRLKVWRREWKDRQDRAPKNLSFELPNGTMQPIGYVASRYSLLSGRPTEQHEHWLDRARQTYAQAVLAVSPSSPPQGEDQNRLALLKDYRSLMPLAQEARKPMFLLKPADGAVGGYQTAVQECFRDFESLAKVIEKRIGLN